MKIKKKKKSVKHRGSHTHGRGAKKKARGSGHRGGKGKAGTGKRADQKKSLVINKYGNKYFGKDRVLRKAKRIKLKVFNLSKIEGNIKSFVRNNIAKESNGFYEIDLRGYKVIGNKELKLKLKIKADAVSKGAKESVEKAGGEIVLE